MSQSQSTPVATVTENNISIYINGVLYPPVNKTHPNFEKIKDAIKLKNWSVIPDLIDVAASVRRYISKNKNVKLENGVIYYKNQAMNTLITSRILSLLKEGFDFIPLLNFIENLHQNPSFRAVNELYKFLEHFALPITEDGHFLAYKAVKNNYKDIYSGTFDNSVGKTPSVDRNSVDEDYNRHCSHGLHVGAITYVTQYGGFGSGTISPGGNRLMIVKVNPADAVCVPGDHNCTKLRVCRYEVIGEIFDVKNILDKAVYTAKGGSSEAFIDNSDLDAGEEDSCDCDEVCDDCSDDLSFTDGKRDGENDSRLGIPYESQNISSEYDRGYKSAYITSGLI